MPELPEIETVKLQLQRVLPGKKIVKVKVLSKRSVFGNVKLIEGKKVLGIARKAKLLLIDMEGEADLAIHFKMTGQLVWVPRPSLSPNHSLQYLTPNPSPNLGEGKFDEGIKNRVVGGHPTADFTGELPSKHTRVIFHMDGGTLYFNDQRLFGWVKVSTKSEILNSKFVRGLGPEPFEIDKDKFLKILSSLKRPIKSALMDQKIISGVGNIYANDALWESRIDPRTPVNQLSVDQLTSLFHAIKKVLKEGIKYGGATAADAKYIDLHGLGGHYQDHFRVYGREGEECLREDGGIIHRHSLGGRGTYFCPKCQK